MNKTTHIILDEVVRNKHGEVVATKQFLNEVIKHGKIIECTTREIIKLAHGRIVIDQVIHRSRSEAGGKVEGFNFLTGLME